MRRTVILLTILTVTNTYVISSAEVSTFRTGDRAREPRPLMDFSETAWKDALVALADANLIDLLNADLDVPIPRQAISPLHLTRNKKIQSYDAPSRRDLLDDHGKDGHQSSTRSPTGSPTASPIGSQTPSPTPYFSPSIVHDIEEDYYTGAPSPSLLPTFNVDIPEGDHEIPTASPTLASSSPTTSTPTASPTLAPLSPTAATPTASPTLSPSSSITSTPAASPTLASSSPAATTSTASPTSAPSSLTVTLPTGTAEGFESDSPSAVPAPAPDAGEELSGARAAMTVALVGVNVSTAVATLAILIAVVATANGAEAFLFF